MPLLLSVQEIERLNRRKRARRLRPQRPPAKERRELERRLAKLWDEVLRPAAERIKDMARAGRTPADIAEYLDEVLRLAEFHYGLTAEDVSWRWQLGVDRATRGWMQRALGQSLGVDITAVLDTPAVADALARSRKEAADLIRTIPRQFLADVAGAVHDNFTGVPLPEGRSLERHLEVLGGISRRRARVIARDQTTKLAGTLNQVRQQDIGIEEYVWRTVKDRRVVGNPTGEYPDGNDKHQDHYHREGKRFRWDSPPPDGHPGQAIQCRCRAEPVIDVKKILAKAREA